MLESHILKVCFTDTGVFTHECKLSARPKGASASVQITSCWQLSAWKGSQCINKSHRHRSYSFSLHYLTRVRSSGPTYFNVANVMKVKLLYLFCSGWLDEKLQLSTLLINTIPFEWGSKNRPIALHIITICTYLFTVVYLLCISTPNDPDCTRTAEICAMWCGYMPVFQDARLT